MMGLVLVVLSTCLALVTHVGPVHMCVSRLPHGRMHSVPHRSPRCGRARAAAAVGERCGSARRPTEEQEPAGRCPEFYRLPLGRHILNHRP